MKNISKETKFVLLISSVAILLTFYAGINSELSLGDEIFHFRFAKSYYILETRPVFDPLIHTSNLAKTHYIEPSIWHYLLSLIWRVNGNISISIMQLYQSFFLGILIFSVFLLAKDLYDERVGLNAALLVASAPFFVSFSILCYVDVPVIALSILAFSLSLKRYYFISGLVFGLSILTKRNALFFLFPLIFLAFYRDTTKFKIRNLSSFLIPMILVMLPDLYFRYRVLFKSFGLASIYMRSQPEIIQSFFYNPPFTSFVPDGIFTNPISLIQYMGAIIPFGIFGYIIFKKYEAKDILILFPILLYLLLYFIYFEYYAVRYLTPIFPLFAILGAKGFTLSKRKVFYFFLVGCFLQFSAADYYTYKKRHIPIGIKEAFHFIKTNTPTNSRFMVPEITLAEYGERGVIWYSSVSLAELPYLFWQANDEEALKILKRYDINYIMLLKNRVYDDSKIRHLGGYPKSFVEKIPRFSFLKFVFENDQTSIWKILD